MQKFMTMAEVKAKLNPDENMFTIEELISIKVSMEFIQEKFYWEEEDKKNEVIEEKVITKQSELEKPKYVSPWGNPGGKKK